MITVAKLQIPVLPIKIVDRRFNFDSANVKDYCFNQ